MLYNKSQNSLKHDKTDLLVVQLSTDLLSFEFIRTSKKEQKVPVAGIVIKLDHIFCLIPISTLLFSEG
jgi:hypothetical protein